MTCHSCVHQDRMLAPKRRRVLLEASGAYMIYITHALVCGLHNANNAHLCARPPSKPPLATTLDRTGIQCWRGMSTCACMHVQIDDAMPDPCKNYKNLPAKLRQQRIRLGSKSRTSYLLEAPEVPLPPIIARLTQVQVEPVVELKAQASAAAGSAHGQLDPDLGFGAQDQRHHLPAVCNSSVYRNGGEAQLELRSQHTHCGSSIIELLLWRLCAALATPQVAGLLHPHCGGGLMMSLMMSSCRWGTS